MLHQYLLATHLDDRCVTRLVDVDREPHADVVVVAWDLTGFEMKLIGWSAKRGGDRLGSAVEIEIVNRDVLNVTLRLVLLDFGVGIERVGAEATAKIDRAHSAEHLGIGRRRRKISRDSKHFDVDSVLDQRIPPGRASPVVFRLSTRKRNHVAKEVERAAVFFHRSRGRRDRRVGSRVPVHEVENTVTAGIHSGHEVGPGHGALGRVGSAETLKRALPSQLFEIRHLAFLHQPREDHRIHPIDAHDEDTRILC